MRRVSLREVLLGTTGYPGILVARATIRAQNWHQMEILREYVRRWAW